MAPMRTFGIKLKFIMKVVFRIAFVGVISSMLVYCTPGKVVTSEPAASGISSLSSNLGFLASDDLEGRATGSAGEIKAGNFIADRFKSEGLAAAGENGSYFQSFTFKPKTAAQIHGTGDSATLGMALVKEITGRNVIGFMDNGAATTVVIGAHYDHLGWGDENSLWAGEKAIHNGADDNASGVSVLIDLASSLKGKYTHNNYLFMAFSGEEKGLWGSNYFCKNPTIDLGKVNYMLNMDMVGRLNAEKTLAINGVGTSPAWMKILPEIKVDGIQIVTTESGVGPSDHTSFYLHDIPVLHFFTGQHEDYHKPTDDIEKINFEGMRSVEGFIMDVIRRLDNQGKIAFTKTKDEQESTKSDF
ncbi:MAG: M28 family peptidase, partial [Nitrospirota bacterium]|nr:M28 family peptidase [Nitrospirota bacterium]